MTLAYIKCHWPAITITEHGYIRTDTQAQRLRIFRSERTAGTEKYPIVERK